MLEETNNISDLSNTGFLWMVIDKLSELNKTISDNLSILNETKSFWAQNQGTILSSILTTIGSLIIAYVIFRITVNHENRKLNAIKKDTQLSQVRSTIAFFENTMTNLLALKKQHILFCLDNAQQALLYNLYLFDELDQKNLPFIKGNAIVLVKNGVSNWDVFYIENNKWKMDEKDSNIFSITLENIDLSDIQMTGQISKTDKNRNKINELIVKAIEKGSVVLPEDTETEHVPKITEVINTLVFKTIPAQIFAETRYFESLGFIGEKSPFELQILHKIHEMLFEIKYYIQKLDDTASEYTKIGFFGSTFAAQDPGNIMNFILSYVAFGNALHININCALSLIRHSTKFLIKYIETHYPGVEIPVYRFKKSSYEDLFPPKDYINNLEG